MTKTEPKEHGIIFTAESIRGVLEGRKTQTRRIIHDRCLLGGPPEDVLVASCPYGIAGDRLWVRENWSVYSWRENNRITVQFQDGATMEDISTGDEPGDSYERWYERMAIQSTDDCTKAGCAHDEEGCYTWPNDQPAPTRLRPSIHMPRWASRITLEILKVRVERLQDISEEDAIAEGCEMDGVFPKEQPIKPKRGQWPGFMGWDFPQDWYADTWDDIHGEGAWDKNPWVWAIEFKRV